MATALRLEQDTLMQEDRHLACLLDSHVWLAAAFAEHPAHAVARQLLRSVSAEEPALWCRATQQSFLRLASTPVITQAYGVPKATNGDAWAAPQTFLALPQVDVVDEPRTMRVWESSERWPLHESQMIAIRSL